MTAAAFIVLCVVYGLTAVWIDEHTEDEPC